MSLPATDSTRKDSRNLPYRNSQWINKVAMHISRVCQKIHAFLLFYKLLIVKLAYEKFELHVLILE